MENNPNFRLKSEFFSGTKCTVSHAKSRSPKSNLTGNVTTKKVCVRQEISKKEKFEMFGYITVQEIMIPFNADLGFC